MAPRKELESCVPATIRRTRREFPLAMGDGGGDEDGDGRRDIEFFGSTLQVVGRRLGSLMKFGDAR
jgi:hypothetical protein